MKTQWVTTNKALRSWPGTEKMFHLFYLIVMSTLQSEYYYPTLQMRKLKLKRLEPLKVHCPYRIHPVKNLSPCYGKGLVGRPCRRRLVFLVGLSEFKRQRKPWGEERGEGRGPRLVREGSAAGPRPRKFQSGSAIRWRGKIINSPEAGSCFMYVCILHHQALLVLLI